MTISLLLHHDNFEVKLRSVLQKASHAVAMPEKSNVETVEYVIVLSLSPSLVHKPETRARDW